MNGKGYGMPSSHAQFVAFFSLSLTLFLLFRHTPKPSSAYHTPLTLTSRAFLSSIAVLCASAVAASRIYLNYHTVEQVLVGCGAGAFSAIAWFSVTTLLRRQGWVEWAIDTRAARMLRMRDLVVEEDLAEAGWERWEVRRKKSGPYRNGLSRKKR
jgi:dolichyldiphosphatase